MFLKMKRKIRKMMENKRKQKFVLPFECLIGISDTFRAIYFFHHGLCYRCVIEVFDKKMLPDKKKIKNIKIENDKISYEWVDSVFQKKEAGSSVNEVKKQLKKLRMKVNRDFKKYYFGKKIIKNLDLRKSLKVQHKTIEKAKRFSDISLFLQPMNYSFSHLNCAFILYEKTNEELFLYHEYLKVWANDKHAPGASIIKKRLEELDTI